MRFIKEDSLFDKEYYMIKNRINLNKKIPKNIFNKNYTIFKFFHTDLLITKYFFKFLKSVINTYSVEYIRYLVLTPDPYHYYFKEFGVFGIGFINSTTTDDDFNNFLMSSQNKDIKSRFIYADEITIFSESSEWIVFADVSSETGIFAFKNEDILKRISVCSTDFEENFFDIQNFSKIFGNIFTNIDFVPQLIQNYSNNN